MPEHPVAEIAWLWGHMGMGDMAGGQPGWQGGEGWRPCPCLHMGTSASLASCCGAGTGMMQLHGPSTGPWSSPGTPPLTPASTILPDSRAHPALQSPAVS